MPEHDSYYNLSQFQARSTTGRWWPKVIVAFAFLGGLYGAAIGSVISTTGGAADVIGIAAAIMALICGVPGARFGSLLGMVTRTRFGRLFLGILAAMGGTILGGLLGMIAVMPLGAILGAVGGWLVTGAILRRGFFRRLLGQAVGVVLGASAGVTILALSQRPSVALVGIAWGLGTGVIVGPLPPLLFARMMDSLAAKRHPEGEIIDVEAVDVSHDKIEGSPDDQPRSL
jgi:hypothetical protein